MARPDDTEVIDKFEEFYRSYYRNEIADLAQRYPSDQKSLYIDWQDLSRFDTDLADDFRNKPAQLRRYAEEALRLYDLPVDVSLGQAHVRVTGLSETTDIRAIRSDHRGMLIRVQGIIRKATDVRPKVTTAAFECQRCGTLSRIPQESGDFQEPHECQGCERQGPFQINYDQSEFIDAQKLRVQESPEGLRGGETPQSIDVNIEDDITGEVTPGDHVAVTGVLKLEQQGSQQEKSPMFDIYMDGLTVEIEDEEFEEMNITDDDKKRIIELSNEPDIYEQIKGAIAPSIYGYEKEKTAMALQLFSGVTKFLPDGSRTRGDLHMLLIGDPGTGKCQKYDTDVLLADGRVRQLGEIVEAHLDDPVEIEDGYRQTADIDVLTTDGETVQEGRATRVWKREAPDQMYRIHTASGRELEVTPSHPLFVQGMGHLSPVVASELSEGEFLAVPRKLPSTDDDRLSRDYGRAKRGRPNSPDTEVVPGVGEELRRIREALALSQFDCGLARSTYQHYERGDRNPSRGRLRTVVSTFEERLAWLSDIRRRLSENDRQAGSKARQELTISQAGLATGTEVTQGGISNYEREDTVPDGGTVTDASSVVLDRIDEALAVEDDIARLRSLVESDIGRDRIESIAVVEPDYEWVYDLEVSETRNYISEGVVSHNSALLQYVDNIAPRSVYTSGKGATSAGLTAAAVRDDFGDGQQWTLEAGALVLADRGIAAVDELDKMSSDDQSAMHQALEEQSISVNKAGINATLKSRCSLLGAANPTMGRFDKYEPMAEQIDLTPPLISRFDLIFTVTDQPDPEEDAMLAEHILQTNYAGELHTHRTEANNSDYTADEVDRVTEEVAPTIEPDLLRKYIAFARRTCFPTMTEEAKDRIQEFYVDLRAEGTGEEAPVPVTARKLEALVRLAEASARVRLSDTVERSDADRAVDIAHYCLKEIGLDPETGELDADVIETGTSKTQRDRVKNLLDIVADIEDEYDEGAPVDVVVDRAEEVGITENKAEHEIEKLKQKGEVYAPRPNHLRTT